MLQTSRWETRVKGVAANTDHQRLRPEDAMAGLRGTEIYPAYADPSEQKSYKEEHDQNKNTIKLQEHN